MTRWFLWLAMVGCAPKVPPHLQLDPPDAAKAPSTVVDLESAVAAMVAKDPLARAPHLPPAEALDADDGREAIAAYAKTVKQLERGDGQVERALQQLEDQWPNTVVVPLARGYRLRIVENLLAQSTTTDEPTEARIAVLLTSLQDASGNETLPARPLAWLGNEGVMADRLRLVGDRWVLASWLYSPDLPLSAVGTSLDAPMYDGLIRTPVGALVSARAKGLSAPHDQAWSDLEEATRLALTRAAADRDGEQAKWSDTKKAAATELNTDAPIAFLLQRAATGLTQSAGDSRAAGGALLALAALRWEDACTDKPCRGLDRVEWMEAAGKWGTDVEALASVWRVVALKESTDSMDVGHNTVLFPTAIVDLVDALIGTSSGNLDLQLVRRTAPDAAVWLELARATGAEGATNWADAQSAIGSHLETQTQHALDLATDSEIQALLDRISSRAVP